MAKIISKIKANSEAESKAKDQAKPQADSVYEILDLSAMVVAHSENKTGVLKLMKSLLEQLDRPGSYALIRLSKKMPPKSQIINPKPKIIT